MNWMNTVEGVLQQYSGNRSQPSQPQSNVGEHFDQVAGAVPGNKLGEALAATFRSEHTGSFSDSVSKLFEKSNGQQKLGLLNLLAKGVDSGVLGEILGKFGISQSNNTNSLTSDQAQKVSPDAVRELAAHAENNKPDIVDEVSHFYAQHPGLVKTLGGAALSVLLTKVAERRL